MHIFRSGDILCSAVQIRKEHQIATISDMYIVDDVVITHELQFVGARSIYSSFADVILIYETLSYDTDHHPLGDVFILKTIGIEDIKLVKERIEYE